MTIIVTTMVQAPINTVWYHYTRPEAIMVWNTASEDWHTPSAQVDLRVGGTFCSRMEAKDGSMGFDFAGTYTAVDPPTHLAYTFGGRVAQVYFETTEAGTSVTVSFDAEEVNDPEMQRAGWQAILDNFARYCEAAG